MTAPLNKMIGRKNIVVCGEDQQVIILYVASGFYKMFPELYL